jgi:RNA polymerase sigma factor (sigma-70 family)
MTFPQTRLTQIQRLAAGGSENEWREFVADYWGPVFHFCLRKDPQRVVAAEEITTEVFEVLWLQKLLERWADNRAAKLRTLICAVARNLMVQRFRSRKDVESLTSDVGAENAEVDSFYASWAEDLVRRSLDNVAAKYRREGQSDYLRVFLGRASEGLSIREVAESLSLPRSTVDHHFRHVRDRLREELGELLREQVKKCCDAEEIEAEYAREWEALQQHLQARGDFDQVLRESFAEINREEESAVRKRGIGKTVLRLSAIRPRRDGTNS